MILDLLYREEEKLDFLKTVEATTMIAAENS